MKISENVAAAVTRAITCNERMYCDDCIAYQRRSRTMEGRRKGR